MWRSGRSHGGTRTGQISYLQVQLIASAFAMKKRGKGRRTKPRESRQKALEWLLKGAGHRVESKNIPYPKFSDIQGSRHYQEVDQIFRNLGGRGRLLPVRLRKWDLALDDIAVELDEECHFNRYRLSTLGSKTYKSNPAFPMSKYLEFCRNFECRCSAAASYGNKWSSRRSEQDFGMSSPPKRLPRDVRSKGPSRWKQRAFYDYLKDLAPLLLRVRVARISIWDDVSTNSGRMSLNQALRKQEPSATRDIIKLIKSRARLPKRSAS